MQLFRILPFFTFVFLSSLSLFSCAKQGASASGKDQTPTTRKYYESSEIFKMMEASQIHYIVEKDSTAHFDLRELQAMEDQANPEWIVRENGGQKELALYEPNFCAASESKMALDAFSGRDFDAALSLYRKAYDCDTNFVKMLTYIGNVHFSRGELPQAIEYFKKSIRRNPYDYQAHYFLSHAFLKLDSLPQAIDEFVEAYILNRKSANLASYSEVLLEKAGYTLRNDHLHFGFSIAPKDKDVEIRLAEGKYAPMAFCLAAYYYEPTLANEGKDDQIPQKVVRNCLANQAIANPEGSAEKLWSTLIEKDLFSSVVVWEIGTNVSAQIPYLLPDDVTKQVREYIKLYLLQKI